MPQDNPSNYAENTLDGAEWLELHFEAKKEFRRKTSKYYDIRIGDRILDIGSGAGSWFDIYLNKIGARGKIVAIEPNPDLIEISRGRSSNCKNIEFSGSNVQDFLEKCPKFDVIIFGNSWSYLQDHDKIMSLCLKCLDVGGRIIIRQHDEGGTLFGPVDEIMFSSVKLGVAKNSKIRRIDYYEGRNISEFLRRFNFKKIKRRAIRFEIEGPFSDIEKKYLYETAILYAHESNLYTSREIKIEWQKKVIEKIHHNELSYFFEIEHLFHAYS